MVRVLGLPVDFRVIVSVDPVVGHVHGRGLPRGYLVVSARVQVDDDL